MREYEHDQERGVIYRKGKDPEKGRADAAEKGLLQQVKSWFQDG
jgi:hypothetical protein